MSHRPGPHEAEALRRVTELLDDMSPWFADEDDETFRPYAAPLLRAAGAGRIPLSPVVEAGGATDEDRALLEWVAAGRSNAAIGVELGVSVGAVQRRLRTARARLGLPPAGRGRRRKSLDPPTGGTP